MFESIKINEIHEGYSPRKDFTGQEKLKGSIEKSGSVDPLSVTTS